MNKMSLADLQAYYNTWVTGSKTIQQIADEIYEQVGSADPTGVLAELIAAVRGEEVRTGLIHMAVLITAYWDKISREIESEKDGLNQYASATDNVCTAGDGRYYINPTSGSIGLSSQNYVWGVAKHVAVDANSPYTFVFFDFYDEFADAVSNVDDPTLNNNPTIYVAWYDHDKALIGNLAHGNITVNRNTRSVRLTVTSPADAVYAATYIYAPDNSIRKEISEKTKIMIVKGNQIPVTYVPPYVAYDEAAREIAGDVKLPVLDYVQPTGHVNTNELETGGTLRIMGYNVAMYRNGTDTFLGDDALDMRDKLSHFAQLISTVGADVICTQEDRAYLYYPRTPMKPADIDDDTINVKGINKPAYQTLYANKYPFYSGAYIGGGVDSTDAAIYSGAPAGYDVIPQTVVDGIIVPGMRYAYTDITVGGEFVHVYNCHLSASAKDGDNVPYGIEAMRTIRKQQLSAMLAVASNNGDRSRRWVIAGDLNHNSDADKANLLELCETYHAKIANGSSAGWLGTRPASQPISLDNVIVSEGLTVAGFSVMREWENALYSDHAPIVADIMVVHGCGRDGGSGQFTGNFYGTATSQARRLNGTTLGTAGTLKCMPGDVYNIHGTISGALAADTEGATLQDVVFSVYFFGVENGEDKRTAFNRTGNNMGYAIAPDWATTMEVCCTVLFEAGKTAGPQSCTVTYDYLLTRVDTKQRTGAVGLHIGTFNTGMFNDGHNDGAPFNRENLDEKYIAMSRFVAENDFGILCLQELSQTAQTSTGANLLETLKHYYPYGLNKTEAIYTQYPVLKSDRGSFTAKYDGNTRNWSLAELLCDGLRVVVMCLHLAYQTDAGSVREEQATEAIGILGEYAESDAVIVCGDFNDFDHSVFALFAQNGYVPLNGRDGVYAVTTGHNTEYRAMNAELQRLAAGGTIPAADMDNATNIVARLNTALGVNYSIVDGVPHDYSPEIANSSEVSIDNILIKADHFTGGVAKCPFLRDEDAPDEWRSYLSDHIALSANITIE